MTPPKLLLGVMLGWCFAADARAACLVPYSFANYGFTPSTYTYVHFGAEAAQSTDEIVGRFWKAGDRESANEGFYDDSQWMSVDRPDEWYFQGWLSQYGTYGCLRDDDMILVLQDPTSDGSDAVFVAGRVRFNGFTEHVYPFWLTGGDWNAVQFPSACRRNQKRRGNQVTVDLALDQIDGGFYGQSGMLSTDTMTGYTIWTAYGNTDAGRASAAWTHVATIPNTGVPGEVSGLQVECRAGDDLFVAVGIEFDHGQFTSDFVGKPTRIVCARRAPDLADVDADGTEDRCDNCPGLLNRNQNDYDGDGVGDACDDSPQIQRQLVFAPKPVVQ
jgi:hypothetical protein